MAVGCIALTSCSKEETDNMLEGPCNPMVWISDRDQLKVEGNIKIPKEGGTYTYTCLNYIPWGITEGYAFENEEKKSIINNLQTTVNTDWVNAEYKPELKSKNYGGYLTASFSPNKTKKMRKISLTLEAGNTFFTFRFVQEAGD